MMLWAVLGHLMVLSSMTVSSLSQTKLGCQQNCGNVNIPHPFGLGDDPSCFIADPMFKLFCNTTYDPPLLFMSGDTSTPILNISTQGQMTITIWLTVDCYNRDAIQSLSYSVLLRLKDGFRFSDTRNKFTAIGCDTQAFISDNTNKEFQSGCVSFCRDRRSVSNGSCSAIGCCQTAIPKDVTSLNVTLKSFRNHSQSWSFNPCSFAFLADSEWFKFYVSDLWNFSRRVEYNYQSLPSSPVVLDWAIGNVTCEQARRGDPDKYACGVNSFCSDSNNGPGYLCHCNKGYEGNPYLGCQDIDECNDDSQIKPCVGICTNLPGSYTCSCPLGQLGDGKRGGSGCTSTDHSHAKFPIIQATIGGILVLVSVSSFYYLVLLGYIYWGLQRRKLIKLREKFFYQNGGLLLQQKLSSNQSSVETTKVFTSEELKEATENYHESRILGQGGYGTVYKGILSNGRIVAIKKSMVIDKEQIEQFINEVLILSQINHRNIVKLLGCCLETEVPLLVYEFISNGTLFHHIHEDEFKYTMSWSNRMRIAAETAGALAYLHSSASQPIIHRDIKSTNILLDDCYIAKVADFGASRLGALDESQLSTLVQGTMGYLDPEYLHTSLLTDKSDVYSFGVVLVELLTGRQALSFTKPEEERNLAMFFVSSLRKNRLLEILEHRVVIEGDSEQIKEVANLARRCLRLNGEERPTMKEVAMELEGMIRITDEKHAWIEKKPEESSYLLNESVGYHGSSGGYDSMRDQVLHSLNSGR